MDDTPRLSPLKRMKNAINKKRDQAADKNVSSLLDAPQLNLPRVETRLDMHKTNGLFDPLTPAPDRRVVSNPGVDIDDGIPQPTLDAAPEWTSAVGHASTGKSGRVIHNLQEDIARLKRDLSVYRSRAEEAQHTNETLKEQIINIGERLRNSEQSNETNLASIARKDRKIEDLRTEVQNEKARRVRAEAETSKVNQLMSEEQDEFHRKCAELQESANHYTAQYEVLSKSSLRERADTQRKLKGLRDDLLALRSQAEKKDREQERLDALIDRQNQELEAERKRIQEIFNAYDSYKTTRDRELEDLIKKGRNNQATVDAAVASLKEAEDKMKWVMNIKKNIEWSE
ncbi:hypothetical protein BGW36DRAFT_431411 [Talaromyces proteolyticus]|uniref:SWI5-dependent HO expression protein 3 n=1 Tax=Talaromyces proteolyticus TaxID=1131652 RepID=A0AAD4PX32_9EURO|nr:uncharacterized protein BGW36DRAFT_431411 [Talaromyces proteolyticus]KAH8692189.1 hypothetical protein BGW36DRAFT_431411 [Talaromyces proteolyticus]